MKKIILGLLFVFSITTVAHAEAVKIAALINGEIISTEDIDDQTKIFMLNSPVPLNAETKGMIKRRVLSQTIEQKLKNQAVAKENITFTDQELDELLNAWAKKNHTTPAALKSKGINLEALKENIKAESGWIRLIRKKYYQGANLTQKEINDAIDDVTKDMSIKKYQVQEIFLKKENASDINALVDKLRDDDRFELYAARFSDAPSAANGGNLGWINSGKMLSAIEMRLNSMEPGDVSDAILIGDGYYIVKLIQVFDPDKHPNFRPNTEEVKNLLENQKMEAISTKLLQNLKQKAIIEVKKQF